MLVFDNSENKKPQAFLDRIRKFADLKYSTSTVIKDHPSVVLEMNKIKFDLVPALSSVWGGYQIPNGPNAWQARSEREKTLRISGQHK